MITSNDLERLDILAGTRRGPRDKAAVRIEDLNAILSFKAKKLEPVTGAPTMEQYNALLKEVSNLTLALETVSFALQAKLRT